MGFANIKVEEPSYLGKVIASLYSSGISEMTVFISGGEFYIRILSQDLNDLIYPKLKENYCGVVDE